MILPVIMRMIKASIGIRYQLKLKKIIFTV